VFYLVITAPGYSPATAQTAAAARRAWAELAEAGKHLDEALLAGGAAEIAPLLEAFVEKLEAMAECAERARQRFPEIAAESDYVLGRLGTISESAAKPARGPAARGPEEEKPTGADETD
jgi:thiamine pyrophosphate-dependent acetolactate synthase large subunit-like protein